MTCGYFVDFPGNFVCIFQNYSAKPTCPKNFLNPLPKLRLIATPWFYLSVFSVLWTLWWESSIGERLSRCCTCYFSFSSCSRQCYDNTVQGIPSLLNQQFIFFTVLRSRQAVLSIISCSPAILVDSDWALLDAYPDHRTVFSLWISLVTGGHRWRLPDHTVRISSWVAVVVEVLLLNHWRGHHRRQMGYTRKN